MPLYLSLSLLLLLLLLLLFLLSSGSGFCIHALLSMRVSVLLVPSAPIAGRDTCREICARFLFALSSPPSSLVS